MDVLLELIKKIFTGLTNNGYLYINGITAVIAAFVPLTTIIFAQYYDKNAENANESLWRIKDKLAKEDYDLLEIQTTFKKMVYVGGNSSFFNFAIIIFSIVCSFLIILWGITGISYVYGLNSNSTLSGTDTLVVISSTLIFIVLLVALPIMFSIIKKRVPIKIKNEGCPLENYNKVFEIKNIGDYNKYYSCIQGVHLRIPLITDSITVQLEQAIPITDYQLLYNLKVDSRTYIIIKLNVTKGMTKSEYEISENLFKFLFRKGVNVNPQSILNEFNNLDEESSMVYMKGIKKKHTHVSCRVKLDYTSELVDTSLGNFTIHSLDGENALQMKKGGSVIILYRDRKKYTYRLKLKK